MPDYAGLCRMRSIKRFVFRVSQPVPGGCLSKPLVRAAGSGGLRGPAPVFGRVHAQDIPGRLPFPAGPVGPAGPGGVFPGRVEPDHTLRARSPGRDRVVPMIRRRRKGRRYMRLHRGNAQGQCTGDNARAGVPDVQGGCRGSAACETFDDAGCLGAGKSWAVAHSSLRQAHPGG